MLGNWGAWLGIGNKDEQVSECEVECDKDTNHEEVNKPNDVAKDDDGPQTHQLLQKAKGFSGLVYNIASNASKKLSESVVGTAQTIKQGVEEGRINGIIDQTIFGDFQKEQEKFVQEKKAKEFGVAEAAEPPWVGFNEEDAIQQQILALSVDKRNFLRAPPAGVQFHFDFQQMYPVAMVMLEEDEFLQRMRFHLVPKQVKEEVFWKNYFYRVSLIKQSARLTALVAQQSEEQTDVRDFGSSPEDVHDTEIMSKYFAEGMKLSTPSNISRPNTTEEEISTSLEGSEFVSDAFDSCKIHADDLRKEMEQLVLDKRERPYTHEEVTADWERELQEELQEYDVLADNDDNGENWDKEIEEMLKKDG